MATAPVPIVLSPSEIHRAPGRAIRLAGRIWRLDPELVLVDALASVTVRLAAQAAGLGVDDLAVGDLVTVEGELVGSSLERAALVAIHHRLRSAGHPLPGHAGHPLLGGGLAESERLRLSGPLIALGAKVRATVRSFLEARGYLEVETPVLVPSPGLDLHLDAFAVEADAPLFLGTSPEYQMKRLLVGGMPRIYQLTRSFRRGEHGARHNHEFTILEWYSTHTSYSELMDETEALVRTIVERHAVAACGVDVAAPFSRLPVLTAFADFASLSRQQTLTMAEHDPEAFFRTLVDDVEPALGQLGRPVFLFDYPKSQASLARLKPSDPDLVERFELYVGDLELCNGFGELTDPIEQRLRFERDQTERARAGKPVYPVDERFVAALHEGMPPASGNALGLDRLLAVCAGAKSIDQVMTFPREWL